MIDTYKIIIPSDEKCQVSYVRTSILFVKMFSTNVFTSVLRYRYQIPYFPVQIIGPDRKEEDPRVTLDRRRIVHKYRIRYSTVPYRYHTLKYSIGTVAV